MNHKNEDFEFLKSFSNIKISQACKKVGIARQNIYNGKCSEENLHRIRRQIENDIAELYLLGSDADAKKGKNTL